MKKLLFLFGIIALSIRTLAAGETDLVLRTPTGNIYGSLLTPENDTKEVIALFISGSGPTDRDGNNPQLKNNAIKFLAEELCDAGIASIRYDKRFIAASAAAAIKEEELRFSTYVDDARGWIDLFAKEYKYVVVIGHSEGAQIGVLAAAKNPKVAAVITLAGSGRRPADVIRAQLGAQSQQLLDMCEPIIKSLEKGSMVDEVSPVLFFLFRPSVQPYLISWFATDPTAEIAHLQVPVLIVQGDMDLQTLVEDADLLAKALPKASKVIIKGMNHVFKECDTTNMMAQYTQTYGNPNLKNIPSLAPTLIKFIRNL